MIRVACRTKRWAWPARVKLSGWEPALPCPAAPRAVPRRPLRRGLAAGLLPPARLLPLPWGMLNLPCHSMRCYPGAEDIREVRLAGGPTKYEGRVEVKLNGTWVAASGEIGGAGAAAVVCRQLGLAGGVTRGGNAYGGATPACAGGMVDGGCTPTVDYRDVSCKGTEASLSECSWTTRSMLAEALGVACDGERHRLGGHACAGQCSGGDLTSQQAAATRVCLGSRRGARGCILGKLPCRHRLPTAAR